jgi:hypothetical protein
MTTAAAAADESLPHWPGGGLVEHEVDQYRAQGDGAQEGGRQTGARAWSVGRSVQHVAILSAIVVVQLGWLGALGYGFFLLV